jgi:hypothetical protein
MFDELIRDKQLVKIYYERSHRFITGIITDYDEAHGTIQLGGDGAALFTDSILKIEIILEPYRMFQPGYMLATDADYDNAMYLQIPVNVWRCGNLLGSGVINENKTRYVTISGAIFHKENYLIKVKAE